MIPNSADIEYEITHEKSKKTGPGAGLFIWRLKR
jgi:hypothetical protein